MARPSKLTQAQWQEIEKRRLAGESFGSLSKDFGISKASIIAKVGNRLSTIKEVANQLVSADTALRSLPIPDQIAAVGLAQELQAISSNLASAARLGAQNAHRLNALANSELQKIDDADPLSSMPAIKAVAVLTDVATKSASIGLNLLAANKGQLPVEPPPPPARLPEDVQDAAIAYAKVMG